MTIYMESNWFFDIFSKVRQEWITLSDSLKIWAVPENYWFLADYSKKHNGYIFWAKETSDHSLEILKAIFFFNVLNFWKLIDFYARYVRIFVSKFCCYILYFWEFWRKPITKEYGRSPKRYHFHMISYNACCKNPINRTRHVPYREGPKNVL